MKFRGRLPRKGPLPFRYVFLLTFVFFTFSTAAGLWIINEGLKPTLISYANSQTKKIAAQVINKAVNKKVTNGMDVKYEIVPGSNGDTYQLSAESISRISSEIVDLVHNNIKQAERGDLSSIDSLTDIEIETDKSNSSGGIVYYVPMGQATNNALLGNLGPKLPIRFSAIGSAVTDIEQEVEEVGINNFTVKVFVHLKVDIQIIIPFATETTTVKQRIPIVMNVFKGDVPQFYNNGGGDSSPSIELPGGP